MDKDELLRVVTKYHEDMKKPLSITLTGEQWSRIFLAQEFVAEALSQYKAEQERRDEVGGEHIALLPSLKVAPREVSEMLSVEMAHAINELLQAGNTVMPEPPGDEAILAHVEYLRDTNADGLAGGGVIIGSTDGMPHGEVFTAGSDGGPAKKTADTRNPSLDNMVMMGRGDGPEAC